MRAASLIALVAALAIGGCGGDEVEPSPRVEVVPEREAPEPEPSAESASVEPAATPFWLDVQRFPVVLLVIAYATRRLPYVVRSAVAGLEQVPEDYERAAANLGAGTLLVLRRIVFPLIFASLLAGALMAFVFAMLEVSDSLILAQSARYFPITRAIWELSQRLGDGVYVASALGVWAMTLLTLTLVLASNLLGKKLGAMFKG